VLGYDVSAEDATITFETVTEELPEEPIPDAASPESSEIAAMFLDNMDEVEISSEDGTFGFISDLAGDYLGELPNPTGVDSGAFLGSISYYADGLPPPPPVDALGPVGEVSTLDVLVLKVGDVYFITPLNGTLPEITDEASLAAFYESIVDVSGGIDLLEGESNGTVNLSDFDFETVVYEGVSAYGDHEDDILNGTSGNDDLYGGGGSDQFFGGDGNDYIFGGEGSSSGFGALGEDAIAAAAPPSVSVMNGGSGNDYMIAGTGTTFMNGGEGGDYMDGSAGNTIAVYSDSASGVTISLATGNASGGEADGDTLINMNGVIGSEFNDVIGLNGQAHYADGGGGNDRMFGLMGDDVLDGGAGNDILRGGNNDDELYGGADNDLVDGQNGDDTVYGDDGNDEVVGGAGNDEAYGGLGDDEIYGDAGNDDLYGGENDDLVFGGAGNDDLYGDGGEDILRAGGGNDDVYGGNDADLMYGGGGNDYINGGEGNDRSFGDSGNDYIASSEGNDVSFGGSGEDVISFGNGTDRLFGGSGDDEFRFDGGFLFLTASDSPEAVEEEITTSTTRIFDFVQGEDTLDIFQSGIMNLAQLQTQTVDTNFGIRIDLAPDHAVHIKGLDKDDLTSEDFIFMDYYDLA
jgi:Ca2+-binding RTX toxin-like protein